MKYLFIFIGFLLLSLNQSFAQIAKKGQGPFYFQQEDVQIPVIVLKEINLKKIEKEDREHLNSGLKSIRFAENIPVNINLENDGLWKTLPNGDQIWYIKIKSLGAYSLSVLFNHFRIPPGSELYIYNRDNSFIRGAFTYKNNKPNYILPIAPVQGDEIIIEYYEPKNVEFNGELQIASVAHDYKDVLNYFKKDTKTFGSSGSCNVNINCETDSLWQLVKHSVCKITYNGWLCSGTLINNTNNDGYPYFLTANHCINNNFDASRAIFYFNYESVGCVNIEGPTNQTVSGSSIVASPPENTLDFTLLELSSNPPSIYKPYYAGWSIDFANPSSVTSIHHPSGDIKKITKSYDGASTEDYGEGYNHYTHWWIDAWDEGTTEGGSSGSPLFNQNGEIIGDLSGGDASCSYNYNDYYLQFHHAWQDYAEPNRSLKSWLDPTNSKVISIKGFLPYDENPSHLKAFLTDTVVNLAWNKVLDESIIDYFNIYRNSVLIDTSTSTDYQDTTAYRDSVYKYYIKAKISAGGETDPSNSIYIRSMDSLATPYGEDFEGHFSIPQNYYEERASDSIGWQFKAGGYTGVMDTAYEGSVDAYFYDNTGESAKLVLPRFDFSGNTNVLLSFYLFNKESSGSIHELKILYKNNDLNDWKEIRTYSSDTSVWTKKSVSLPNLSANYQIAIEAIGLGGYGICIDSIAVEEDGSYVEPVFSVSQDSICKDENVIFSTSLSGTYSFSWDFGTGASPQNITGKGPHIVSYLTGGIKTVKLTVNDTYIKEKLNSVAVFDIPQARFKVTENTLTSNSPFGNQWYLDGSPIIGATKQSYVIIESGNYYVETCSSQSVSKHLIVVGIEDLKQEENNTDVLNGIRIYPNPNQGDFTFEFNLTNINNSNTINYRIVDITGRVLRSGSLFSENNKYSIHTVGLNDGLYFLQVNYSDKYYTSKVVIKK